MSDSRDESSTAGAIHDELSGGYIYSGDGDWSKINAVMAEGDNLVFETESVHYTSVPGETRTEAYELHQEGKRVIVHPDGYDVSDFS